MADTLKWLYSLLHTFLEWSSRLFEVLQYTFTELIALIPDNNIVGSTVSSVLTFIVDGIGIGDLTIIGFAYGTGFTIFLALMLLRWIRGLM